MNILSFTYWTQCHDTSAAIVSDGELVAAAEEERLTRRKHDDSFPFHAIEFCLERAGLRMSEIEVIAFPLKPFRTGPDSELAGMDRAFLSRLRAGGAYTRRAVLHKRVLDAAVRKGISFNWKMEPVAATGFRAFRERYGRMPKVRYYDHHLAHAAATYLTSPYDDSAIATIDNRGGQYSTVTWSALEGRITRQHSEPFFNSLGQYYYDCTRYLGLGEFDEGKTMGLAPYGNPQGFAPRLATLLDMSNSCWFQYRRPPSLELLGFPRRNGEQIVKPPYTDFAAACQAALECAFRRIAVSALRDARSGNLCLSGGVALNCSCNGALLESGLAPSIWVFPASGDGGLSVGAALLCAAEANELRRSPLDHAYLGPDFSAEACEAALKRHNELAFHKTADVSSEVARLLADGKVVGWFQGRMELGPRALGNRSVLADPRPVEMRDRVNRLKGRELWRPLAPSVLAERASEFFTLRAPSPFMLFAASVRPEKRPLVPAIVHVDGSARPQTVTREQNPVFYDLLSAFGRLTGIPLVLNTSFNAAGEPIVCTPEDAIKSFLKMSLDVLVLGEYVVRRKEEEAKLRPLIR